MNNTAALPILLVLSETSRKTIPDIDTASLNCNQNKRAYFAAIIQCIDCGYKSDAWKKIKKNIVWKQKRMAKSDGDFRLYPHSINKRGHSE